MTEEPLQLLIHHMHRGQKPEVHNEVVKRPIRVNLYEVILNHLRIFRLSVRREPHQLILARIHTKTTIRSNGGVP